MDGIDPQNLLTQVIAQERVNMLFLPPTVIYTPLAQPKRARLRSFHAALA